MKIIKSSECTVVPSQLGEAFGLVAAESMALGVPVIASNSGELNNIVNKGGGIVVDARDFDQFKKSIELILKDKKKSELSESNSTSPTTLARSGLAGA